MKKIIFIWMVLCVSVFGQFSMHQQIDDTTDLKVTTGVAGAFGYMTSLSSANSNGGGWFVVIDSAKIENGVIAYDHPTAGSQWVREEYLETGIVNVKWAGAKGDSSNDDGAELRRASLAANSDNSVCFFPPGNYMTSARVMLAPGTYEGVKGRTFIRNSNAAEPIFMGDTIQVRSSQHYRFKGLELIGSGGVDSVYSDHPTAGFAKGIGSGIVLGKVNASADTSHATIYMEDVIIRDVDKEAFLMWFFEEITLINCHVYNCGHDAYNPAKAKRVTIIGCTADSVARFIEYTGDDLWRGGNSYALVANCQGEDIFREAVTIGGGDYIDIINNTFQSYDTTLVGAGADSFDQVLIGTSSFPIDRVRIIGNTFDRSISRGIFCNLSDSVNKQPNTGIREIIIKDNVINDPNSAAIRINDQHDIIDRVVISGNEIWNWDRAGNGTKQTSAIYLYDLENVTISNNIAVKVSGSPAGSRHPLYLSIGCDSITVTRNDFRALWGSPYVRVDSMFSNLLVYGNDGLRADAIYNEKTSSFVYGGFNVVHDTLYTGETVFTENVALGDNDYINIGDGRNFSIYAQTAKYLRFDTPDTSVILIMDTLQNVLMGAGGTRLDTSGARVFSMYLSGDAPDSVFKDLTRFWAEDANGSGTTSLKLENEDQEQGFVLHDTDQGSQPIGTDTAFADFDGYVPMFHPTKDDTVWVMYKLNP